MMAWSKLSVGLLVGGGVAASALSTACSSKDTPVQAGPSTMAGTSNAGGAAATAGASAGGSGGASAGTSAGGSGGAVGFPPMGDKCGSNTVKHPDGLCYCQPASLSACTDGCADFQTDANHCGGCDTKCEATQACRAGKCTASPTALVPAAPGCGAIHLALGGSTLYWTDEMHGTVQSIAASGGTAMPLVTGQLAPTQIAVNGTALYWLASGSKAIMTAPLAGGTATQVAKSDTADIGGFTFSEDGKTLYFSAGTVVSKTSATPGGAVTEVGHEDSGIPHALAVAGNLIAYPADLNGDVDIMTMVEGTPAVCASEDSMTATNLNCARVARSQGGLFLDSMYLIGGKAYWLNGPQVVTTAAINPDGANETVATATNPNALAGSSMTIAGTQVYFADDTGYIYSAPLMVSAEVATLARGQMNPTSMVADDAKLYWANTDCSIMSVPLK
jgi:hypothetical protein